MMPYRMRFIDTLDEPLAVKDMETAFKRENESYHLQFSEGTKTPMAELHFDDEIYAQIEINQSGDGLFDEEIQEMLDLLLEAEGPAQARVENVLKSAKRTIAVQVLSAGRKLDALGVISPLWSWLFLVRKGLLYADGEGYYDEVGIILEDV